MRQSPATAGRICVVLTVKSLMKQKKYNIVLTIAGSDSSGGAGIMADIKTCTALGVYSMGVITAVTAQNSCGVKCVAPVSARMVENQLDAILEDVRPDAVKIGMIPNTQTASVIADKLIQNKIENIVIDPVSVSTSGHALSSAKTTDVVVSCLFPISTLITPNIPEAEQIFGIDNNRPDSIYNHLFSSDINGRFAVLLKGGHAPDDTTVTDRLFTRDDNEPKCFAHPFVNTSNTHGTGCTLSSAVAAFLSRGCNLETSVALATEWLHKALTEGASYYLGKGHGPVNHIFNEIEQWKLK